MPVRTCVGCRRADEKSALTRVVFRDGSYAVDPTQTLPGRGAYLHRGCGAMALRRRALPRALRVTGGSADQLARVLAAVDGPTGTDAGARPGPGATPPHSA